MDKVPAINKAIKEYFDLNKSVDEVRAKDLIGWFIKKGAFKSDQREGKPIRDVLRDLDRKNQLHRIPAVYADRKAKNTNWFFVRSGVQKAQSDENTLPPKMPNKTIAQPKAAPPKSQRDQHYVIDLCDEALKLKASREHRFDFLLGDPGKHGHCTKLPVDAYYESLLLVIEYRERQHTDQVKHFDKPDIMTVSGVHRGEQREIYDQRRRDELPKRDITLIEISYSTFDFDSRKKIVRNHASDLSAIRQILNNQDIKTA